MRFVRNEKQRYIPATRHPIEIIINSNTQFTYLFIGVETISELTRIAVPIFVFYTRRQIFAYCSAHTGCNQSESCRERERYGQWAHSAHKQTFSFDCTVVGVSIEKTEMLNYYFLSFLFLFSSLFFSAFEHIISYSTIVSGRLCCVHSVPLLLFALHKNENGARERDFSSAFTISSSVFSHMHEMVYFFFFFSCQSLSHHTQHTHTMHQTYTNAAPKPPCSVHVDISFQYYMKMNQTINFLSAIIWYWKLNHDIQYMVRWAVMCVCSILTRSHTHARHTQTQTWRTKWI